MRRFTLALALAIGAALAPGGPADASPRKVCHGVQKPCGDQCYDPFTQTCTPGVVVCNGAQKPCGGKCYDPFWQICHPGGVVCAGGQKACGDQCYDPVTQDCAHPQRDDPPDGE